MAPSLIVFLTTSAFAQQPRNSDIVNIGNRNVNRGDINFISIEKEVAMGRQLSAEFERQVKLLDDAVVNEYVNRLGQNIALNSDTKLPMTIKVVESDEVNGQVFPGGFVYVNAGLIRAVDNEAELASVFAQLIAHIAARHMTENASKAELVSFGGIPVVVQGGVGGFSLRQSAGSLVPAQFAGFVRQQTYEADYLGLQYLFKAGYDTRAANTLLQKLEAQRGTARPNPPIADRITTNRKNILLLPARSEDVVTTPEFDSIKARIK